MYSLGINIGSSSIKAVLINENNIIWSEMLSHDGDLISSLRKVFETNQIPNNFQALVTGNEGRYLLNINNAIEPICIEEAIKNYSIDFDAVVSLGGENLIVYRLNDNKIISNLSGNKCASGTGEFFKQQLGRMDMQLEDIHSISPNSKVMKLSSRCSVFMKSDCTHKLNKGEATRDDIVVSLSDVMATKVVDFLKRAKITKGNVLLTGGVTNNPYILNFIKEKLPEINFICPDEASYFEAYGAALLARDIGTQIKNPKTIFKENRVKFDRFQCLKESEGRVVYIDSKKGKVKHDREYILGVDGGSTTTKACLIDIETDEVVASFYGRTHGDPVSALKKCLIEIKKQLEEELGNKEIKISLASTTGSSREILGVFLETPAVYNEIIAHSVGTTFYKNDIDTIFEIGGQDAKYVFLKNGVPIDYAMNEACSAGTGSFLEESSQGDLNIKHAWEIGDIAIAAKRPLKFGEHCSAFINSDIRKAIQQNASREDITAGLVTSIVSNYLNRVVCNRTIGNSIVLQGGVAKNKAIPLAFAMLLNKDIIVPPDPELMGCFGVGILAKQKLTEGLIEKSSYNIDDIIASDIIYEREFKCKACDNQCPIRVLKVNEHKYMFGGRCNKYTNIRKKKTSDESEVFDYIAIKNKLMFEEFAPSIESFIQKSDYLVGIPNCLSVYTLWPLYSWFFHSLGVRAILSNEIAKEGVARVESSYCFPAEIAHGAVQNIWEQNIDYIFLPHLKNMDTLEKGTDANLCPITQSLPYYINKAFPEIPKEKYLAPIIGFSDGENTVRDSFIEIGYKLGFSKQEAIKAFNIALEKQQEYFQSAIKLGEKAIEDSRKSKKPVIALLGRPYNAFTPDANMGIPKKFTSRGYSIIPFDILPFDDKKIFPNMYWYYGQQDMKSSVLLKDEDNIFITFISNFSCAPDSFMLHYVKWIMGTKPFLILELDSHTADAGIDTRVEAFLDIIDGYRLKLRNIKETRYDNNLRFINNGSDDFYIKNIHTGEKIQIRNNPKVKLLLSNMGRLTAELMSAAIRSFGINCEAMPLPDMQTLQLARNHVSGKECLPSHLVLGSILQYLNSDKYRKDELYLLFVPTTTGPCRTGQYFVFYENLFKDLRIENLLVLTLDSDNSYSELGPGFSKCGWWGLMIADYMKDIETSLRTCAENPIEAMQIYDKLWHQMIAVAEKDIRNIPPMLKSIAKSISEIPLKRKIDECPRVLIVGEIYVRRDDFAVDELIQNFSEKGIIGKVSTVTEWIYYCDFIRYYIIKKNLQNMPFYKRYFSKTFRELLTWKIEQWYKRRVDKKIKDILKTTKLIPDTPHNMKRITDNAEEIFVSNELYSEITVSCGATATAMMDGYSGIVNISPFACLIGRVIEGLITPWSRKQGYPVMSIEIDGNLLPPNIISNLEIFMLNVKRYRDNPDISMLIHNNDEESISIERKIIRDK
ncbi:MAG: acyl-CoA dehydratase activase [Spirochaetota bacterium]|nr:acyl-CoA dehydratase activase [Spirochaetota bacterium]